MNTIDRIVKLQHCNNEIIKEMLLLKKCGECSKGPCIGRIWNNTIGYAFSTSVYTVNKKFYLDRCSIKMTIAINKDMARVQRIKNKYYVCMYLDQEIQERSKVTEGDINIHELYMGCRK